MADTSRLVDGQTIEADDVIVAVGSLQLQIDNADTAIDALENTTTSHETRIDGLETATETVDTVDIANDAVITDKIADLAVTRDKLSNSLQASIDGIATNAGAITENEVAISAETERATDQENGLDGRLAALEAEIDRARGNHGSVDSRLDNMIVEGGTAKNYGAAAGTKTVGNAPSGVGSLTVESAAFISAGMPCAYTLSDGVIEENSVSSVAGNVVTLAVVTNGDVNEGALFSIENPTQHQKFEAVNVQFRSLPSAYGFGEGSSAETNRNALLSAIDSASANGGTVYLPDGTFNILNLTLTSGNVLIRGGGMPQLNDSKTGLIGGTILTGGQINLNNQSRVTLVDLGVAAPPSGNDCIRGGNSGVPVAGFEQRAHIENVAAWGNGANHCIVFSSGHRNRVRNVVLGNATHGLVFRCAHSQADMVSTWNCGTSGLTLKSDGAGTEDAVHNIVTNLVIDSDDKTQYGGIWYHAVDGGVMKHNVVQGAVLRNVTHGLVAKTDSGNGSIVQDNLLANAQIESPHFNGVLMQEDATRLSCDNVTVRGGAFATAFNNATVDGQVFLHGCHAVAVQEECTGAFEVMEINGESHIGVETELNAAQSIPSGTWTTVAFTDTRWERGNHDDLMWDVANPSRLVYPFGGRFDIAVEAVFANNNSGVRGVRVRRSKLYVGGNPDSGATQRRIDGGINGSYEHFMDYQFSDTGGAGDYLEVQVFQSSGGVLDLSKCNARFVQTR